MKQQIVSHLDTSKILFECEVPEGMESGLAMRYVLEKAVESGANLSGANLSGAYLSGANLSGAYLSGAYLSGANLSGANLSGANLSGANLSGAYLSDADLSGAYLSGANLSGANLSGADLSGANLSGAYLSGAYLSGANLSGANLSDADLSGANLSGAIWLHGVVINLPPVQISQLHYAVTILDAHMQCGCELHTLAEWAAFDDTRIVAMDGKTALTFWRAHKDALLMLARSCGRSFEPVAIVEAA